MKSIQELYKELSEDDELKEGLAEAANAGRLEDFLEEHGYDATLEEFDEFFREMAAEDEPLSFDELEQAAGGDAADNFGNFMLSVGVATCVVVSIRFPDHELCQIKESGVDTGVGGTTKLGPAVQETGDGSGIGVVKLW